MGLTLEHDICCCGFHKKLLYLKQKFITYATISNMENTALDSLHLHLNSSSWASQQPSEINSNMLDPLSQMRKQDSEHQSLSHTWSKWQEWVNASLPNFRPLHHLWYGTNTLGQFDYWRLSEQLQSIVDIGKKWPRYDPMGPNFPLEGKICTGDLEDCFAEQLETWSIKIFVTNKL